MLFLQKTHPISWTLNLSRWHSTPPGKTQKHSQNASSKEPKGSETVPWTRRILQEICPQTCRHFKSSNTLNKKGCRIQMDTRVREMLPDTKGILETGTDTQISQPPSKIHIVHRRIKVRLRWQTNTTQRRSRPPHHIRKWTISWITIKLGNTHKGGLCNLHVNLETQLLYQHSQNNSQKQPPTIKEVNF